MACDTMSGENPLPVISPTQPRYGQAWSNLIRCTKVADLLALKHRRLVTLSSRATVEDAIQLLARENVRGLPIVNAEEGVFFGFVDVLDIAGYILSTWKKISPALEQALFPQVHLTTPVVCILNFSQWNHAVYIDENASVQELITLFSDPRYHRRIHRVAVLSAGNVVQLITQTDVIAFAHRCIDAFGSLADKTVSELNLIRTGVVVAGIDERVADMLEKLYENRISALTLVDFEGRLRGAFSASDLRGFKPNSFEFFNGTTSFFLFRGTERQQAPNVTSLPNESLRQVIRHLVENRVHRVFITDSSDRPIGVASMGDILNIIKM